MTMADWVVFGLGVGWSTHALWAWFRIRQLARRQFVTVDSTPAGAAGVQATASLYVRELRRGATFGQVARQFGRPVEEVRLAVEMAALRCE